MRRHTPAALAAATILAPVAGLAETSPRAALQAAMQRHFDSVAIDDAFQYIDLSTGEIVELYQTESRPMILSLGEDHFVLCAKLVARDGTEALVDYYVAPHGGEFRVIQAEVGNRDPLRVLLAKGKVTRLD